MLLLDHDTGQGGAEDYDREGKRREVVVGSWVASEKTWKIWKIWKI